MSETMPTNPGQDPALVDPANAEQAVQPTDTGVGFGEISIQIDQLPDPTYDQPNYGVDKSHYEGRNGMYNVNNGTVNIVTSEGEIFVAPMSGVTRRFIQENGLTPDETMSVLGSNSEFYGDDQYLTSIAKSEHYDDRKLALAGAADRVEATTVLPEHRDGNTLPGFMRISGQGSLKDTVDRIDASPYTQKGEVIPHELTSRVEPLSSQAEDYTGRLNSVGNYAINNGVIAFVDGRGDVFAAPATEQLVHELEEAGYATGFVSVPMSNGERFVNDGVQADWEAMQAAADEQQQKVAA